MQDTAILGVHESWSPAFRQFVAFAHANKHLFQAFDPHRADANLAGAFSVGFTINAWPSFMEGAVFEEFKRVSVGMPMLLKSLPERVFGTDYAAFARYYGMTDLEWAKMLMEPPTGALHGLTRLDTIYTDRGCQCLEANVKTSLGGWKISLYDQMLKAQPLWQQFTEETGIGFGTVDTIDAVLTHIVRSAVAEEMADEGELNLALVVLPQERMASGLLLSKVFERVLKREGLTGKAFVCSYSTNELRRMHGMLFHGQEPIQVVFEYTSEQRPPIIYPVFKSENCLLFNGPIELFTSDKRNMALLWEQRDSGIFNDDELDLIDNHLPFTARLIKQSVSWRGQTLNIPEDILADRGPWVIKPGRGFAGDDVFVGARLSQEQWAHALSAAMDDGTHILQEYCEGKTMYYQDGDEIMPHDVVLGGFGFGDIYGGGFIRMVPQTVSDGVVNASRNASEGLLCHPLYP